MKDHRLNKKFLLLHYKAKIEFKRKKITRSFFNFEPEALILAQEISNFFVVDLKVGDPDQELDVVIRLGDVAKDVSETVRNNT
jgi:hypothetical protein